MSESVQTLAQLKKADRLIKLYQREHGPRSYRRGVGVLLRAVAQNDGATQREIVAVTGWSRHNLKNIAKKAEKQGLVTITNDEAPRTYRLALTEEGKAVVAKRETVNENASDAILSVLSEEEVAQLNTITEKLIVGIKQDTNVTAWGKNRHIHKGHRGHRPHSECK